MDFGVLGRVEIRHDGTALPTGSVRERFVLAMLLLNAGRLVSADRLVAALWPAPPRSARAQIHNMVSSIRARLRGIDDELIVTVHSGYELRLGRHRLDLFEFRSLVTEGRQAHAAGDHAAAAAALGRALALWRGPALADVPDGLVGGVRQALGEERLTAAESKLDADLSLGRTAEVLYEVAPLVDEYPYREGLYRRQMIALAAAGRRADALAAYRSAFRRFVDDLGVEPGAELRDLERKILRGERLTQPPTATAAVPRQLPPVNTTVTGRDELLTGIADELRAAADAASPVVVLVGPGGIGKTTLALVAGHRLSDQFPDGQLYADLRGSRATPADPHEVVGRFLRALGVPGASVPEDRDERLAMYRSRLADRRILVVLDDVAEEAQLRPLLPASPRCGALVTSRRRLTALVAAARFTVPPLTRQDAVRLLERIAGGERVAADPQTAVEITGLCGGLPLAICIAGARLAVRQDWTLDFFRQRLTDERGRLDELAVGDLDVRASIALSYHALSADAQRLFRRLGMLPSADWPAWVAGVVADGRQLDQLTDLHLVAPLGHDRTGQLRYRLHDLVAEYARERLTTEEASTDQLRVWKRLLTHWLGLAEVADERIGDIAVQPAGTKPPLVADVVPAVRAAPLEWFETERVGLVAAVDQACRLGLAEIAARLALRLSGFLGVRCHHDEWERTLRRAVSCAREREAGHLLPALLGALFIANLRRDSYAELPAIASEELAAARRFGDRTSEVSGLRHLGLASGRTGRFRQAVTWLECAVSAARNPAVAGWLLQDSLASLGFTYWQYGQPARAVPILEEALAVNGASTRPVYTWLHRYQYGLALTDAGRLTEAADILQETLLINQQLGDDLGTAYAEQALADVAIREGRLADAVPRLQRALTGHRRLGHRDGQAEVLRSSGDLAAAEGRWADAVAPLRQAATIRRRIGARSELAVILARLDRACSGAGDESAAATYRRQWRAILDELALDETCLRLPPFLPPGQR